MFLIDLGQVRDGQEDCTACFAVGTLACVAERNYIIMYRSSAEMLHFLGQKLLSLLLFEMYHYVTFSLMCLLSATFGIDLRDLYPYNGQISQAADV